MIKFLSIFSFSTIKEFPKPTKTFVWFLFFMITALSLYYFYINPIVKLHTTKLGNVIQYFHKESQSSTKTVVFFGSSLSHAGINKDVLNRVAKNKKVKFINLSQLGLTPWHYKKLVENSPRPMSKVHIAVLEIFPWMFNENALNPSQKPLNHHHGSETWNSLSERLKINDFRQKLNSITLKLMAKSAILDWYESYMASGGGLTLAPPLAHSNTKLLADNPSFKAQNISKNHFNRFRFNLEEANLFKELLIRLDKDNIKPIIFIPPVRKEYYEYIQTNTGLASEFNKYKLFLEELAKSKHVIYWKLTSDCQLNDSIFVDYGHCNFQGSLLLTNRIYNELKPYLK